MVRIGRTIRHVAIFTYCRVRTGCSTSCMNVFTDSDILIGGKQFHRITVKFFDRVIRGPCAVVKMNSSGPVMVCLVHFQLHELSFRRGDAKSNVICMTGKVVIKLDAAICNDLGHLDI